MDIRNLEATLMDDEQNGAEAGSVDIRQMDASMIEADVVEALRTVYDPEIPVNIYELGLIYDVEVETGNKVYVRMTLTSPACPVAGTLPPEVEAKVRAVPGVTEARVDVVWDPPWNMA